MMFDAEKFVQRQWEKYRASGHLLSDHDRANQLAQAAYDQGHTDALEGWPWSFKCTCGKVWRSSGKTRPGMRSIDAYDDLLEACVELCKKAFVSETQFIIPNAFEEAVRLARAAIRKAEERGDHGG